MSTFFTRKAARIGEMIAMAPKTNFIHLKGLVSASIVIQERVRTEAELYGTITGCVDLSAPNPLGDFKSLEEVMTKINVAGTVSGRWPSGKMVEDTPLCGLELPKQPTAEHVAKLEALLLKHGVCTDCGEMYSHDLDAPFASCKCKQSEWYDLTPYMKLESRLKGMHSTIQKLISKPDATAIALDKAAENSSQLKYCKHNNVYGYVNAFDMNDGAYCYLEIFDGDDITGKYVGTEFSSLVIATEDEAKKHNEST